MPTTYVLAEQHFALPAQYHNMLNSLNNSTNLYAWWKEVKNAHGCFATPQSHYTQQLESTIKHHHQRLMANQEKHLFALYSQVINWQTQHAQQRLCSRRATQIDLLKSWLEQRISQVVEVSQAFSPSQVFDAEQNPQLTQEQKHTLTQNIKAANNQDTASKMLNQRLSRQKVQKAALTTHSFKALNSLWRNDSSLGLFKPRSKSTRALDKAIRWQARSFIFDETQALREILIAIDVWKQARIGISERTTGVLAFEARIKEQLGRAEQKSLSFEDRILSSSFGKMALLMFVWAQDLFLEFASVMELDAFMF